SSWSDEGDPGQQFGGTEQLRELRVLGQAGKTYLIAEGEAGVYLVDQHAAHERVLLEELRASLAGRSDHQLLWRWPNRPAPSSCDLALCWSRSARSRSWFAAFRASWSTVNRSAWCRR